MIVECTVAYTYDIDDSFLDEYIKFAKANDIDPNFYSFINWFSDTHKLEDTKIDEFLEWDSVNGSYRKNDEFDNILENYFKK